MNRTLRRRHRWMVPLVGLTGAALLVAALGERTRVPAMDDWAALDRSAAPPADAVVTDQVFSPDSLLDIALWSGTDDSSRSFLGLRARGALPYPSGQVYWRPAGMATGMASLLGPLTGQRWAWFVLPDARRSGSLVIIHSPGFAAAVDSGPLPPLGRNRDASP